ncbi:MAG: glycoside hydrolase family 10 protein [Phycisphaerales bacterium]
MPTNHPLSVILLSMLASAAIPPASSAQAIDQPASAAAAPTPELRGTWLTTTANDAISTPANTARTMRRLREIGLNTVYVECWKNGYTQYPSKVLERVIGVDRRPNLMPQDPSDTPESLRSPPRDLLAETLAAAHASGLVYIAWFEYGFMAAHKDTDNHLRRMKPEWLSRNLKGDTVAPNGFVWMNPLHPDCRRFLTDLVLEAVDRYDLDGVQLDDRIVWPHVTMGYDEFTRAAYAAEHNGRQPPDDHTDPAWIRWRAEKINEYARQFVAELRAKRPGLIISLSPAVYPWCYENYCLEWPKWASWGPLQPPEASVGHAPTTTPEPARTLYDWDEFIPQNYRFSYDAFEKTWLDQLRWWRDFAPDRSVRGLIPGIRLVGDGADSTWDQLRRSILLARDLGNGGHVLWFSRGVLDVFADQLTEFYNARNLGPAPNPHFPADWRPGVIRLARDPDAPSPGEGLAIYHAPANQTFEHGNYLQLRLHPDGSWTHATSPILPFSIELTPDSAVTAIDTGDTAWFIIDRRRELSHAHAGSSRRTRTDLK